MLIRRRFIAVAVAAAFTSGTWLVANQTPAQRELRQRHVYVNAVGPNDAPIKDLKVEDLLVREDDRAREVLQVVPAPPAGLIAIVVDDSAAASDAIHELRLGLLDFSRYLLALPAPPQVGLTTFGERPTAPSILAQGTALIASGAGFGQGLRCAGGALKRMYVKIASGGSITAPSGLDLPISLRSAALGDVISPGTKRFYFVYYRDPFVLGGCPINLGFNSTDTVQVVWRP